MKVVFYIELILISLAVFSKVNLFSFHTKLFALKVNFERKYFSTDYLKLRISIVISRPNENQLSLNLILSVKNYKVDLKRKAFTSS